MEDLWHYHWMPRPEYVLSAALGQGSLWLRGEQVSLVRALSSLVAAPFRGVALVARIAMDRLDGRCFLRHIAPGRVFLSTHDAVDRLVGVDAA